MLKATKIQALILLCVFMLGATAADAGGRCFSAEIPAAMILPDGSEHPAGSLRICFDQKISPVSILHRADVGGRPTGMFLSAPRGIEESVAEGQAQFVFKRTVRDELVLLGYAVSAGGETTFFDMTRYGTKRTAAVAATIDAGRFDDEVILIAAGH
jgi:hypothetical protein